tara:strand:- start:1855 stop:4218 length:2364 start_codon:yes stop_codon:yes gene_type:complete
MQKNSHSGITLKNYIKAHKGTLINGEIVYPDKKDSESPESVKPQIGIANPYSLVEPKQQVKLDDGGAKPIDRPLIDDGGAKPQAPIETPFIKIPDMGMEGMTAVRGSDYDLKRHLRHPASRIDRSVVEPAPIAEPRPSRIYTPFNKKLQEYIAPKQKLHQENMKGIKDQLDAGMINEAQAQQMWKARNKTFQEELNKDPEYVKLRDSFKKNMPKPKAVPIKTKETTSIKDYIKLFNDNMKKRKNMSYFNKGGTTMEKQMELFDDGGLKDEGGMTDKKSGNKVPSGSTRKEVRDDIPAMVSEGEFIFPADVTRYIGLDRLMELRQDAKMGLQKMEMMGQMGNSDEAVLPDDMPFDMDDIIVIDDMAMGGSVNDDDDVMNMDLKMAIGGNIGGDTDVMNTDMSMQMAEGGDTKYASKKVKYINDKGEIKYIMHDWMDRPMTAIPAGYTVAPDQSEETEPTPTPTPTPQTPAPDDDDDKLDPMKMQEDAERSAGVTAKRLGMSTEDYLKLPMKTRFALLGQELNVMRGNDLDINVRDQIIQSGGQGGDTGFGLIGGLLGGIGNFFDKDGDGSMFTATSADGTVTNWFGQPIGQLDKKQLAALGTFNSETGRWSGGQQRTNISNVNRQSNTGTRSGSGSSSSRKSTISNIDEKKQGFQARKHGSYRGVTKSNPYGSKASQFKRGEDKEYRPGQIFETSKQKQDREDKIRDFGQTSNRGTSSGKSRAKAKALATSKNVSVDTARGLSGAGMEAADASRDKSSGPFSKGSLVTKRKTTKKPTTQRKTLIKRKS